MPYTEGLCQTLLVMLQVGHCTFFGRTIMICILDDLNIVLGTAR